MELKPGIYRIVREQHNGIDVEPVGDLIITKTETVITLNNYFFRESLWDDGTKVAIIARNKPIGVYPIK